MDALQNRCSVRRRWLGFAVLTAASLLLWWRPLVRSFSLAISNPSYTHLLLVIPLAVFLAFLQWKEVRTGPGWIWGALILTGSLVIFCVERTVTVELAPDVRLAVDMLALVAWWIGSFSLCLGCKAFRALAFPLLFLLWVVPMPNFLLNRIIAGLQHGSVFSAQLLFKVSATPVSASGVVLSLPEIDLEVGPECSSIRSSLILIVTTMVLAQIVLRSPWRKLLVVAVSIPLSFAKNGLRIFVLGWIATHGHPDILNSRLHREGGPVFLAVAFAVIFLLIWVFTRGEPKDDRGYQRIVPMFEPLRKQATARN
jgi:exosortase